MPAEGIEPRGAFAGFYSLALLLLSLYLGKWPVFCAGLFVAVMAAWLATCLVQDLLAKKSPVPAWVYAVSIALNIGAFFGWLRTLFGSRIEWREKIYEVRPGGVAVVVS